MCLKGPTVIILSIFIYKKAKKYLPGVYYSFQEVFSPSILEHRKMITVSKPNDQRLWDLVNINIFKCKVEDVWNLNYIGKFKFFYPESLLWLWLLFWLTKVQRKMGLYFLEADIEKAICEEREIQDE